MSISSAEVDYQNQVLPIPTVCKMFYQIRRPNQPTRYKSSFLTEIIKPLTLTFEPLLGEPPQQSTAVFAEGGTFVVVDFEPVGHVDLEALLVDLQHTHRIIQIIMEALHRLKTL